MASSQYLCFRLRMFCTAMTAAWYVGMAEEKIMSWTGVGFLRGAFIGICETESVEVIEMDISATLYYSLKIFDYKVLIYYWNCFFVSLFSCWTFWYLPSTITFYHAWYSEMNSVPSVVILITWIIIYLFANEDLQNIASDNYIWYKHWIFLGNHYFYFLISSD